MKFLTFNTISIHTEINVKNMELSTIILFKNLEIIMGNSDLKLCFPR